MNILILGAGGYTGSRLARALLARGERVRGLVRRDEAAGLEARGMEVRIGDLADLNAVKYVAQEIEAIINLTGYCRQDTKQMRATLLDGTRNLTEVTDPRQVKKYIMASNVAVYGHPAPSQKLDETTPFKPDYPLGHATVEAEKMACEAWPTVVLRVHQIYGPGRDYIASLRAGRVRILNAGDNWQSRIHVDDLVNVLLAALDRGEPGKSYLVGDNEPTRQKEFLNELAQALGAPAPLLLEANAAKALGLAQRAVNWFSGQMAPTLNENLVGLLTANYYILNTRLVKELGVKLEYPTYADGYVELLERQAQGAGRG